MGLVSVSTKNQSQYIDQILAFEASAQYPIGNDFFKIDHGNDYFQFFKRLGDLKYFAWLEKNQVVAVAAGVIRKTPVGKAWYLSDLKVREDYRGQGIPLRLLRSAFFSNYFRCRRGYAVSMDTPGQASNRVAKILGRFRWIPIAEAAQLSIWSLNKEQVLQAKPIIEKHRGPVGFISLKGVKDIVLRSTHNPMPLLHMQFGPLADKNSNVKPTEGAVHMLCSPKGSPMNSEIESLGLSPSSSATIVSHRMQKSDWTWVLTSDV